MKIKSGAASFFVCPALETFSRLGFLAITNGRSLIKDCYEKCSKRLAFKRVEGLCLR